MPLSHRSLTVNENVHFVTASTIENIPLFLDVDRCRILIENIQYYREKIKFDILAYVIMPTHFHLIISLINSDRSISEVMRDIKKYSAWDITDDLKRKKEDEYLKIMLVEKKNSKQNYRVWKRRFHDLVIRNHDMLISRINYIHYNPVKKGLAVRPEDYTFSSAQNYLSSKSNCEFSVKTDFI